MELNKKKLLGPKDIGARLHKLRKDKNISIGAASEFSGVSTNTMYHYERGTRQPSAEVFYKLCLLYGLNSFEYFYSSAPEPLTDSENKILNIWRALSPEKQKALLMLLEN